MNNVFSQVSLILVATFCIFAKSLLTNNLLIIDSTSYIRPHVSGTERVGISKQDARGNLVVGKLALSFLLSELRGRPLL